MIELNRKKTVIITKQTTNLSYICKDNEKLEIDLVDVNDTNSEVNLLVKIKKKSNVIIHLSSLGSSNNKKRYNIKMDHLFSDSKSTCEIFCVAKEKSDIFSVIETKISKKAGGTKSAQRIKGIMLSDNATIGGEPNLIIDKNDVKAAHGLAIGKINIENMFYLMSKGLTRQEAEKLIIFGFFNSGLKNLDLRRKEKINKVIEKRLYE